MQVPGLTVQYGGSNNSTSSSNSSINTHTNNTNNFTHTNQNFTINHTTNLLAAPSNARSCNQLSAHHRTHSATVSCNQLGAHSATVSCNQLGGCAKPAVHQSLSCNQLGGYSNKSLLPPSRSPSPSPTITQLTKQAVDPKSWRSLDLDPLKSRPVFRDQRSSSMPTPKVCIKTVFVSARFFFLGSSFRNSSLFLFFFF